MFSSLILLALSVSACGAATPTPSAIVPNTGAGTGTPGAPTIVNVSQSTSFGPILVDAKGMTLYILTQDTPDTSTCYGSCAAIWPPLLTDGAPTPGSGVNASLLGSTTRTDGSTQVTYNGQPLYYFVNDKAPGDTNGENVQNVWFVIGPDGKQK